MIFRASRSIPRVVSRPTPLRLTLLSRRYASNSSGSEPEGSGVIKQKDKNAKPKILEHVPPAQENSEDVKKHNEEFEDRPDRAANQIDDKGRPVTGKMPSKGGEGCWIVVVVTIADLSLFRLE